MNATISVSMDATKAKGSKDWTDYSKGIAWGTVALCIAVISSYVGLVMAIYTHSVSLPVGMLVATVLIYLGFTVAHEAGHGNIAHEVTAMKSIERLMGWSMTLIFMILPFGLFAKIHDYHHAFTNDPDRDPDHWLSGDSWLEASLKAPTLALNYIYLTLTRFRHDPVITQTHKSSLIYYAITLPVMIGLIYAGFGLELLMVGIIPVFLASYVLGMLFDWIPHMPTRQQGRYQNTRSYLFPGLKYLTLGQSYHHIHHLYPRVSWYHYARVFNLIRPELEAKNAPIETLFSREKPGFGESVYAREPSSIDGIHKLTLRVERVHQETKNAVAITFENMNGKTLPFKAGQYVTVTKWVKGETVTRCYSICEPPHANRLTIGVKQVEGGLLSTYLNKALAEGDELTVAGPFGNFIYDPASAAAAKFITLIAGGSGITPILAIAQTALEFDDDTEVHLIYANRSIADTMFLQRLNLLLVAFPERFSITNIYGQGHSGWEGYTGYLDQDKLVKILKAQDKSAQGLFYICGPAVMKDSVVKTLQDLGMNQDSVFIEEFAQSAPKPEGAMHKVKIALANGATHELNVAENQTVLQVASQDGVKIPHACGVGQCGCCMMQLAEGEVTLASNETPGLLPGEKASGLTLACMCRPKSALVLREGRFN